MAPETVSYVVLDTEEYIDDDEITRRTAPTLEVAKHSPDRVQVRVSWSRLAMLPLGWCPAQREFTLTRTELLRMLEVMGDPDRERWLNGWPRIGHDSVLYGTSVCCVGCGKFEGTACVAVPDEGWVDKQTPAWPFDEATCPVHNRPPAPDADQVKLDTWPPRVVDLYRRLQDAESELAAAKAMLR